MAPRALYTIGDYRLGTRRNQYVAKLKRGGREVVRQIGLDASQPRSVAEQHFTNWVKRSELILSLDSEHTVGDLYRIHLAKSAAEGKVTETSEMRWRSLGPFFEHLMPEAVEQSVDVGGAPWTVCHRYAAKRQADGRSRATIVGELVLIRTVLNWAHVSNKIPKRYHVWVPKQARPRKTNLTASQAMLLIESARADHIRLLFTIALFTGARKSAIEELTWDRVDLDNDQIQFGIDNGDDDILNSGYRKGRAHVAIHPLLRVTLVEARDKARTGHVIEYRGRAPIDTKSAVHKAARRAGLPRQIGVHAFRHTLATIAADAGKDMRVIQKMLGHDDINTTRRIYAKHTPEYTLPAADAVAQSLGV